MNHRQDGRYTLITGERRLLASKKAGKATIPAIVREVSNLQAMEMTIVENLQRADLNPMEQAHAYARLSRDFHMTQEQMAERTGKDRASVANFLRLLKLPESVQQHVEAGELSFGHARALLALESPEAIAGRRAEGPGAAPLRPRHRKLRPGPAQPGVQGQAGQARRGRRPQRPRSPGHAPPPLGLKVTIEDKKGKGSVIIEYSGVDDFDAILTALGDTPAS